PVIGPASPLIAAGQLIFKGALCMMASGYLQDGGDLADAIFAGLSIDGTGGQTTSADGVFSDGSVARTRLITEGVVLVNLTGVAQGDVGAEVYLVDDDTVALTTTNSVRVGRIVELGPTSDTCWVAFRALR
ncbi:MAG: hypothetical protein AAFV29_15845, partial [Myxococcota bacterium]